MTVLVTAGYVRSFETGDVDHGRAMVLCVLTLSGAVLTAALSRLRTTVSRVIVAGTIGVSLVLTQVQPLATALHVGQPGVRRENPPSVGPDGAGESHGATAGSRAR